MLYEIERHCNNYFNPKNDPNDPERNYPPAFLELAEHIRQFRKQPHLFVKFAGLTAKDIDHMTPWQRVFASELAAYKRVKFI